MCFSSGRHADDFHSYIFSPTECFLCPTRNRTCLNANLCSVVCLPGPDPSVIPCRHWVRLVQRWEDSPSHTKLRTMAKVYLNSPWRAILHTTQTFQSTRWFSFCQVCCPIFFFHMHHFSHSCHCTHFRSEAFYYSFAEVNRAVQSCLCLKNSTGMWNATDENHLSISLHSTQKTDLASAQE